MNDLQDAYINVMQKEMAMIRKQEFSHLLYQEFDNVNEVREATLGAILQAEVELAQTELEGLNELLGTAEETKTNFDAEETRLRQALEDLNNADPPADQADIDAAD